MAQALAKCSNAEKAKQRLQTELSDLLLDVERAQESSAALEKKQRQFDRFIGDWKQKCDDLTLELEIAQKESRSLATDVFKLRGQLVEADEGLDSVRLENKHLADEVKELTEQLAEVEMGRSELERTLKRKEAEWEETRRALEESDGQIELVEARVARLTADLEQARAENERRVAAREEEWQSGQKNHERLVESMQASVDGEVRMRMEAVKQKKKLEQVFFV